MTIEEKKELVHSMILQKLKEKNITLETTPRTTYDENTLASNGIDTKPSFDTTYYVNFFNSLKLHIVVTDAETLEILYVQVSMVQKITPEQYFQKREA
jgi:hypothetical protein